MGTVGLNFGPALPGPPRFPPPLNYNNLIISNILISDSLYSISLSADNRVELLKEKI